MTIDVHATGYAGKGNALVAGDHVGGDGRAADINDAGCLQGRRRKSAIDCDGQIPGLAENDITPCRIGGVEVDASNDRLGGQALTGDQHIAGAENLATHIHATACGRRAGRTIKGDIAMGRDAISTDGRTGGREIAGRQQRAGIEGSA